MISRLLIICLLFSACSTSRMMQTDLYFGQTIPGGVAITPAEWKEFKDEHITRVFTKGSTVHTAIGQWYDPERKILITEPTYVVSYFHKNSRYISRQIDSLRAIYIKKFQQQSVLRVDKKVRANF